PRIHLICGPLLTPLSTLNHYFTTSLMSSIFFFFQPTATTEIYTLSLHDALPIFARRQNARRLLGADHDPRKEAGRHAADSGGKRSEEHTSELQSLRHLVCRLLLEKKKNYKSISMK